jgi:hypothetical protein
MRYLRSFFPGKRRDCVRPAIARSFFIRANLPVTGAVSVTMTILIIRSRWRL